MKRALLPAFAAFVITALVLTSGCFHTGASRDLFFPGEEEPVEFIRGTIAVNRHNFTGSFAGERVAVGAEEKVITIDNFYMGEGGGDLYIWAQVHFGAEIEGVVEFDRYVHAMLVYDPGGDEERIVTQSIYSPQGSGRYDRAELMDTLNGTREGLYSLRVEAVGTAVLEGDVLFYDWYLFTVNGIFSDRSYNHNAPGG